jgi:hypothetical protein
MAEQNNNDIVAQDPNTFMAANPFAQLPMNGVGIDRPLQQQANIMDSLVNNDEIPEDIQQKYWYALIKDNTLSFLNAEKRVGKFLNFDISKIDKMFSMPYDEYTFDQEHEFGVVRHVFETKIDRATIENQKNERIMLATMMTEQRHINDDRTAGGGGFWRRLLGRK